MAGHTSVVVLLICFFSLHLLSYTRASSSLLQAFDLTEEFKDPELVKRLLETIHQRDLEEADSDTWGSILRGATSSRQDTRTVEVREEVSQWRQLLAEAIRTDLYKTANTALKVLHEKIATKGLSLEGLSCIGSEELSIEDGYQGRINLLLAASSHEGPSHPNSDEVRKFAFSSDKASCKQGTLVLPKEKYEPPFEASRGIRSITNFNERPDVIQFAVEKIIQRRGPQDKLLPVSMSEEVREYRHCGMDSFLVGVMEKPIDNVRNAFLLIVFHPQSKPAKTLYEKDYSISFQGETMTHQVVVSSSNLHPDFALTAHSAIPREERNRRTGFQLGVMSYNIWNYNGDWPRRLLLIANTVKKSDAPIIGFQEIRYKYSDPDNNQLSQIAAHFPNYNYVYQPAMRYPTEAEGVGIMTSFPIVFTNYTELKFTPDSPDSNKRIALRALLDTPGGQFDFYVTHFSYAKGAGQMQNAWDLLNFMDLTSQRYPTQAVVGDFNIYTDSLAPMQFLTGKIPFQGKYGNLHDVWETVHGKENGYTFSNLPTSNGLINRADRILSRGDITPVVVVRMGEYTPSEQIPASDHLAVLATTQ